MLISYCLPCHKRKEDLLATFPAVVTAANLGPPVEIVLVDYGNESALEPLLERDVRALQHPNEFVVKTYRGRSYYHMAHARNLSIRAASGDYIVITSTDIIPIPNFFNAVRARLAETKATYLRSMTTGYIGVITCQRETLLELGGYDERFEFYGPEDKDMLHRLVRYGAKEGYYDLDELIRVIRTPDHARIANYRLRLGKQEMSALGRKVLEDNDAAELIVANEACEWGQG